MQNDNETYERIVWERRGPVLVLRLNRPEKLNAIDAVMHEELLRVWREADEDEQSSVIVLTGAGRGFCSGGDVSKMTGETGSALSERDVLINHAGRRLVDELLWVEKPLIAMINGPAAGLGATLALFCDICVAGASAKIGDRHVNVGYVAGDGGSVIWPLLVGPARAKELLMTGRMVGAQEAERIGLVSHVVPDAELEAFTLELAEQLAALPPFAVRGTKVAVNRHLRQAVEEGLDFALAIERISQARADHREAAQAFVDRARGSG